MRKIVDSNYLQDTRLKDYLTASSQNFAVLTDFVAMEAYKDNTLVSIFKSMEIVSKFPQQVIVLKNTSEICGMDTRSNGLQYRMIDQESTKDFPVFCDSLQKGKTGDISIQASLLDAGKDANAHMDKVLSDATTLLEKFLAVSKKTFSNDEIASIRAKQPPSASLIEKVIKLVSDMSTYMFEIHPNGIKLPPSSEFSNSFIFRFALCANTLILRWIGTGSGLDIKPLKVRNDIVDVNIAAYGLYFDGVLSADQKLLEISESARKWLDIFIERK